MLRDAGFDMTDGADSFSIQYQNANNSVRHRRLHAGRRRRHGLAPRRSRHRRLAARITVRARDVWRCTSPRLCGVRRPGAAVRHHHQQGHTSRDRTDQRLEPVQRVHVHRQLGLQPAPINLLKYLDPTPPATTWCWTSRRSAVTTPSRWCSPPRRSWSVAPIT
ncbi:MAG: hypothetical protein R2713_01005 [Ilumatobacteraceae bacterium]